jgi:hypothetical protein
MVKKAEVEKLMDEIRPEMRRMLDTVAYETFKDLLDNAFKKVGLRGARSVATAIVITADEASDVAEELNADGELARALAAAYLTTVYFPRLAATLAKYDESD